MSSNQWTPINRPANPLTTQAISSSTPSSTRRSTRVQAPVSYPKTPLRNKPKRRTSKFSKGNKAGSSSTKPSASVTRVSRDLTDDVNRAVGPEINGNVPMSDMGLNDDETEQGNRSTIGAVALAHGTGNKPRPISHTADPRARTRPSRPQTYSCRLCDKPDNDNMVMCDDHVAHQFSGEAWFHHACVGLRPDALRPEVWYCPSCEDEKIFRAFG